MEHSAQDDAALVSFIASRDISCPVCSYNLRGLNAAVCPECSARLHLQVGSENLAVGPWFLAVLSLSLALGFDGVVAILMMVGLTLHPPPSPSAFQVVSGILACFVILAALCAAGIAWFVRRRRRWNRLARRLQWRLAWSLFAAVGGVHALFGWMLTYWLF